jgi:Polysaccharide biosynthesis/export protein
MACCLSAPPWDRFCYWIRAGRDRPLTDVFDRLEIHRFGATLAGVVFLGLAFAWTIWSMRPFPRRVRLRVWTLMAIIGIVPLELTGGTAVSNWWERWDRCQRFAAADAGWSAMPEIEVQPGDTLFVDVLEATPDRPVTEERTIHSDCKIDLGYYGKVYVFGLTIREVNEKIIMHLQRYHDDEHLGLIDFSELGSLANPRRICPSESEYVFVGLNERKPRE